MLSRVLPIERFGGFRLRVRFNDGSEGDHDVSPIFDDPALFVERLRDGEYFSRVFLEFGTLT